jgi:transcriptional regulator with XRE-family HTH domain
MEANNTVRGWRELLGQATRNTQEKHRLAREVGIKPITLKRWVSGESRPRVENIRRLARALPAGLSERFLSLVGAEFPSLLQENAAQAQIVPEISADLYAQVMQTYAQTPPSLAYNALYELIFSHALEHLDPEKRGMSLLLVGCVPAVEGQKVRCLRQLRGMGTPPWERDLSRKTLFLGSESVAGSVVMSYHGALLSSREFTVVTPAHWTDYEQSAIASPILRQTRVAGALLASSVRPHYFNRAHQSLLDLYAHLAVLLFRPEEFYEPAAIALGAMPAPVRQVALVENFEQRVSLVLEQTRQQGMVLTIQQARQCAWQDIAEELLDGGRAG